MPLSEDSLFSPEEWQACLKVLQALVRNPQLAEDSPVMKGLVAKLNKQARKALRKQTLREKSEHDRVVDETTIRHQREVDSFDSKILLAANNPLPAVGQALMRPRTCYVCKDRYQEVHLFYHRLCPACARLNYKNRFQRIDVRGKIALLTGGRIKIGFETGLKLLRDGAKVIITSRFPKDTAKRYALEPDFEVWKDNLQIYGLDLRNIRAVEELIEHLNTTLPHLDMIINNAAQTIRRPIEFYRSLRMAEDTSALELPAGPRQVLAHTHQASLLPIVPQASSDLSAFFPAGLVDRHGQQADYRPENSWRLALEEVETVELLEVQLVNAVAPFLFNSKLKRLLLQSPAQRRFIINVSAMEGQFNRTSKTPFHPHTNMAKAALNMMTRTSASAYAEENIYMNSVDTGWITDEDPHPRKSRKRATGFVPPLDEIDGAARIYDPIVKGLSETTEPLFGHFLKDYQPHPW